MKQVKAGFGQLHDVSDLVAIDVTTHVATLAACVDAWIFPFLNVYLLGGRLENNADVHASFTVPDGGGSTNVVLDAILDQEGTLLGGGMTLAAGYADFFLSLDANYTVTELDGVVDEEIRVALYTVRTGWNGTVNDLPLRIWVGGMYWDAERTIKGSVGPLNYEVLQGPADPFNFTLGSSLDLDESVQLVAEYAFNFEDLKMLTFGAAYRF